MRSNSLLKWAHTVARIWRTCWSSGGGDSRGRWSCRGRSERGTSPNASSGQARSLVAARIEGFVISTRPPAVPDRWPASTATRRLCARRVGGHVRHVRTAVGFGCASSRSAGAVAAGVVASSAPDTASPIRRTRGRVSRSAVRQPRATAPSGFGRVSSGPGPVSLSGILELWCAGRARVPEAPAVVAARRGDRKCGPDRVVGSQADVTAIHIDGVGDDVFEVETSGRAGESARAAAPYDGVLASSTDFSSG